MRDVGACSLSTESRGGRTISQDLVADNKGTFELNRGFLFKVSRQYHTSKQVDWPHLTRDASLYCKRQSDKVSSHIGIQADKKEQSFYNSATWKKARAAALRRDIGLCLHCISAGKVTLADMVHHMRSRRTGAEGSSFTTTSHCAIVATPG
ncbi:hypothetical protein E4K68_17080 [Desulfosporosinus sp. Sb-LF]|nr:hypothetical protein E4K68_17080 [Desulfosporosinus sp. Sb-LF]